MLLLWLWHLKIRNAAAADVDRCVPLGRGGRRRERCRSTTERLQGGRRQPGAHVPHLTLAVFAAPELFFRMARLGGLRARRHALAWRLAGLALSGPDAV